MADPVLVIGNKAWSSWSLRPWLALRQGGIAFAEAHVALRRDDTKAAILAHSPSGKVPVLKFDDGLAVWDSLAICEWAAEVSPGLWPVDDGARAAARAVSAEMHAGFPALRRELPMDDGRTHAGVARSAEAQADIDRIQAIWRDCRTRFGRSDGDGHAGGPFLFGAFSIADAMYAPVCSRFRTYGVALDDLSAAYVEAVLALPAMRAWTEAALAEGS